MNEGHEPDVAATRQMWRDILFPKSAIGFDVFWVLVFLLVQVAIQIQRHEVSRTADFLSKYARSNVDWALKFSADRAKTADTFQSDLIQVGAQLFGTTQVPETYRRLIDEIANAIRMDALTNEAALSFIVELKQSYIDDRENNIDIIRKSGFLYFYLLIIIVIAYQLFVNYIYYVLRTTPKSPNRDTSAFLAEGAFNAIDLTVLAGLTSIYFDRDLILSNGFGFWSIFPNGLLFLCYLAHMTIFAVFIVSIQDRGTKAAYAAYFGSILMSLVMGAVGIESFTYFGIGFCTIILCGAVAMVIPQFGDIGRLAPFIPATSIVQR